MYWPVVPASALYFALTMSFLLTFIPGLSAAERAVASSDSQNEKLAAGNDNPCDSLSLLTLPMNPTEQKGDLLCWAATSHMAMRMFPPPDGGNIRQCEQANNRFGRNDCCANSTTDELGNQACDRTGWPEWSKYDFHALTGKIINWGELVTYLCQRHTPILYAYRYVRNASLHMKIAYGYQTTLVEGSSAEEETTSRHVFVIDPGDPVGGYQVEVLDFDAWFMDENPDILRRRDYFDICPNAYVVNGSCAVQ